ncbi:MAG: hypothetical protein RLZZ324_617 [Candidatus Parcubacteria bacterium]|jgi:hypothetical protein
MENITLNIVELYEEIKEQAFSEGAFTREEWSGIVDEVIEAKRELGEIHDDVDIDEMREALRARWDDFEGEIPVA